MIPKGMTVPIDSKSGVIILKDIYDGDIFCDEQFGFYGETSLSSGTDIFRDPNLYTKLYIKSLELKKKNKEK